MHRPDGASWWKIDFHAHSPSSFDFGAEEGRRAKESASVREWLFSYMVAEVDAIVITDHNTSAGIEIARAELEALRAEGAADFRELTLFAGVELTVNGGYHLIGMFDWDTPSSSIDRILERCNYRGDRGDSNATTEYSFEQAVKEISADGGLAIPAHVETRGFFDLDERDRQPIIEAGALIAAEATTVQGATRVEALGWAPILGSDAHHLDGSGAHEGVAAKFPGSHYTWVKMQHLNLHGVRLALVDPKSSIRTSIDTRGNPNEIDHNLIRSVTVRRGQSEFQRSFSPWMTSIIGGRGVGKSTIVELLRLVMGRFFELPDRLQTDQSWFSPDPERNGDQRYWDNQTVISVEYEKLGQLFRAEWAGATQSVSLHRLVDDEWIAEPGSPEDRFPVLMYSQKQIYETAQRPQSLLRMIDQQPDIDHSSWLQDFNAKRSSYRTLRAELTELDGVVQTEGRVRGELSDVEAELTRIGNRLNSPKLKELDLLMERKRSDAETSDAALILEQAIAQALAEYDAQKLKRAEFEDDEAEQSEAGALPEWPAWATRVAAIELEVGRVRSAEESLRSSRIAFDANNPAQSPLELRIEALRSDLETEEWEGSEDPASRYKELSIQKGTLERALADIQLSKTRYEERTAEASELLQEIRALRGELTRRRREYLRSIQTTDLKLDIFEQGDEDSLEQELRQLLNKPTAFDAAFAKGSGLRVGLAHPQANNYVSSLDKLREALKDLSVHGQESSFVDWLGPIEGRFYTHMGTLDPHAFATEVDLWFPEDRLRVQYRPAPRANLQNLDQASPGQKTAALLTVILKLSNDPLVLDQPEDDLDNKLISDLVVEALRASKSQRQVIVVTHNANIVVNGDAELVVVMEHNVPVPTADVAGSIQDPGVSNAVCWILEGGRDAFEARYRRLLDSEMIA